MPLRRTNQLSFNRERTELMHLEPALEQQRLYRSAFVAHCAQLLFLGRAKLSAWDLSHAEEPHITGELVRAINEDVIQALDAESWMWTFNVLDDPPQNIDGRTGKRRPRIDIEMQTNGASGRRPSFHIEAKRLYRSDSLTQYLGPTGLSMFLTGEYAPGQLSGGMLGYVQTETCSTWREKILAGMIHRMDELSLVSSDDRFVPTEEVPDEQTRVSLHRRAQKGKIQIYHFFLDFC